MKAHSSIATGSAFSRVYLLLAVTAVIFFTAAWPTISHAGDCAKAASFSDPCFMKGQEAAAQDFRKKPAAKPGRLATNNAIPHLGKTIDGKYDIYGFDEVNEDYYRVGNTLYRDRDVGKYVKAVHKDDIGKTVFCPRNLGVLCKDRVGHIVGRNPAY